MDVYKKLAQVPSLLNARVLLSGVVITSEWTQRNVENGRHTKYLRSHLLSTEFDKVGDILPLDISNEYVL